MRIIDNIHRLLGDDLKDTLTKGARLKIPKRAMSCAVPSLRATAPAWAAKKCAKAISVIFENGEFSFISPRPTSWPMCRDERIDPVLTLNQLRQVAAQSGARDIANVEIDVLLTFLLQFFNEKGLMEHLAFKGGTMLRKMVADAEALRAYAQSFG